MGSEPQRFVTPDGTPMVILPEAEYEQLKMLSADNLELVEALAIKARIDAGEGTMPGEVLAMILNEEMHPVKAWRRYRGMTQADLASRLGCSQSSLSQIESGKGEARSKSLRALADILDAPLWALRDLAEDD